MARATDEMLFARHRDITNDSWKGDFDFQCPDRSGWMSSLLNCVIARSFSRRVSLDQLGAGLFSAQ